MELINNVFLLLALSSLFSSAIAVCVPRNTFNFGSNSIPPVLSPQIAPQSLPITVSPPQSTPSQAPSVTVSPPQSPPSQAPPATVSPPQSSTAPTNSGPAEEESGSEEHSGLPVFHKLHSDDFVSSVTSSVTTDLAEICDVTSNPQLCRTSIASHIDGPAVDPTTALENFDMAIEDLKAGLESIDVHDNGRMESVLTAVLTDLMTCDDTFAEMGVDSPLDSLSAKMSKYASNCLAISKLLL